MPFCTFQLYKLYKEEFLKAISLKGNVNKTYNVLLHMFGYFKKLITKEEKEMCLAHFGADGKFIGKSECKGEKKACCSEKGKH